MKKSTIEGITDNAYSLIQFDSRSSASFEDNITLDIPSIREPKWNNEMTVKHGYKCYRLP